MPRPATAPPSDRGGQAHPTDGRRLRREQNRLAVVDALLGCCEAGSVDPGIAEVAAAAGLSVRSVFRYFDDIDDLTRAAIARQAERLEPLFEPRIDPALGLAARIEAFVHHRVRLLEAMGPVGRVARRRAATNPLVAAELDRIRSRLRSQLRETFAPELAALPAAELPARLAAADVVTAFESYELLRRDHHLAAGGVHDAMAVALASLLDGTGGQRRAS